MRSLPSHAHVAAVGDNVVSVAPSRSGVGWCCIRVVVVHGCAPASRQPRRLYLSHAEGVAGGPTDAYNPRPRPLGPRLLPRSQPGPDPDDRAPHSSPWLPKGSVQNSWEAAWPGIVTRRCARYSQSVHHISKRDFPASRARHLTPGALVWKGDVSHVFGITASLHRRACLVQERAMMSAALVKLGVRQDSI